MRRTATFLLIALTGGLLVTAIPASPAQAATGLDPTYGDEGVAEVMVPDPDEGGELTRGLSFYGDIDPLGRVVRADLGTETVVRLDADGQLDGSFGEGGAVAFPESFEPVFVDATEDGIAVLGNAGVDGVGVMKVSDSGAIDEDFGADGVAVLEGVPQISASVLASDVDLGEDGSVVVLVSEFEAGRVTLHRLTASGEPDLGFGDDGTVTRSAAHLDARVFEGLDADGSGIVFLYNIANDEGTYDPPGEVVVERLEHDGDPYEGFGTSGQARFPGGALALDIDERDGSIFVGGVTAAWAVGQPPTGVWHLRFDGTVDRRFSDPTGVAIPTGDLVVDLEAVGDGRVAVSAEGDDESIVAVLRPDGALDRGFGGDGIEVVPGDAHLAGTVGVDASDRVLTYAHRDPGGESGAEEARAFLTEFESLLPTVTDVTSYASSLSVEWAPAEAESAHPVRLWHVVVMNTEPRIVGQAVVAGDVRQASVEGLSPREQPYAVIVQPYDDFGPGFASPLKSVNPDADAPEAGPAPAVSFGVTVGDGFVDVSWGPLPDDGGSTLWGYSVIAIRESDGAMVAWRNVRADVRKVSMAGLANATAYRFYVVAVTSEGYGAIGDPQIAIPLAAGADPAAPTMPWVSVVPQGDSAIVTWGPAVERGDELWGVHVIVIEGGDTMTVWKTATAYDRQVVVPTGPDAEVYVVAQSASGFGPLAGPLAVD